MDNLVWIYENKECTIENIKQVFRQKSLLDEKDILKALEQAKNKALELNQSRIVVIENDTNFEFVISK